MEKKHRKKSKKTIVQNHHVSYNPEVTVKVFKGEHMILTRLGWRKKISKGFVDALEQWMKQNRPAAVELDALTDQTQ
jgi:hypothetical protein